MILIPHKKDGASYAISKLGVAYILDSHEDDHIESHYNAKDILYWNEHYVIDTTSKLISYCKNQLK